MLIVSRRSHEEIVLPDCGVVLKVLAIHGGRVRLGITAPKDVQVFRRELWDRMDRGAGERREREELPGQTAEAGW